MRHLHGDSNGQKRRVCRSCASDQRHTHTPSIYRGVCVGVCQGWKVNL
jgi:hypothetical protein